MQLTFSSLHFVNIWQAMQGFQAISPKTSFLKGIYIVMQRENSLLLLWIQWPRESHLGFQFILEALFFIWGFFNTTVRYLAMPFHILPTTRQRHHASFSVLHHSSISLVIPADRVTFLSVLCTKNREKKSSSFPSFYLQQDTVLPSLFICSGLVLYQYLFCSDCKKQFGELLVNLNCWVLPWWRSTLFV